MNFERAVYIYDERIFHVFDGFQTFKSVSSPLKYSLVGSSNASLSLVASIELAIGIILSSLSSRSSPICFRSSIDYSTPSLRVSKGSTGANIVI